MDTASPVVLNLSSALPEVVLFLSGLVLLVVGALREGEGAKGLSPFAVLVLLVVAAMILGGGQTAMVSLGGHFIFDGFAAFTKVVILVAAALSLLLARDYLIDEKVDRFEFPLLVLFAALGMCMMVSANSFIALYMGLELQSLAIYVLAAFQRDTLRSSEAGLKYFVLGSLASGMLLYGCSLVYGFTGTLRFDTLAAGFAIQGERGIDLQIGALVGLTFVAAGLAFKMAAVPFHMWTPDVYEGAPTPVTAFMASAPKVAAIALTLRVLMQPFGEWTDEWRQIVVFISVASMILGAFAAIGQTNFKRLMAYSGIGHVGYALIGLAAGTAGGIYGVLIYLVIYVAMTLGTFACIMMMRRGGRYVETIGDLSGLSTRQPMMALALAVFMFSLAGIPPLAGFFGKLYVFMAAVDAGLVPLAVIGVVTSVVGAYYYLRIVKVMYFDEPTEAFDGPNGLGLRLVAAGTAVFTVAFILLPGPFLNAAQNAAAALMTTP
ncbi:MAG: NADH-quinone oxidoreductase subunit NuoN [Geminicoccaceae bacterium]|nr:NADH-quinone oxidoreductase subunit NuoN [Geminicoccaceae bacterium]